MKKEIKLILLDLDFTLLNSQRKITPRTLESLKKCQEKGILIGFSTSRGNSNIAEQLKLVEPEVVISSAGGCIYYKNELLHTSIFTLEETKKLFEATYSIFGEGVEVTCDTLDDIFWNRKENKSEQYSPWAKFDDFKNFNQRAMKICIQTTDGEKVKQVAEQISDCDYLPFSDIPWYKLSCKNATKENAIQFLSDYLKIPTENMVAFGDDFSDMGMLKMCGTGVAMGNAIPQVKEIADEITENCDEDGIAVWIEKNLL